MSNKKILVVEDNELNLRLFSDLLKMQNLQVISCQHGDKAHSIATKIIPDLILMDIQLETISGLDIIRGMKADPKLSSIPIIAVTAFAMKSDEKRILSSGCDAYLSKPFTIDNFFYLINKFTNSQVPIYECDSTSC